jgi:hypothetical protein
MLWQGEVGLLERRGVGMGDGVACHSLLPFVPFSILALTANHMAGKLSTETAGGRGRVVAAVFLGQETGDRLLQRGVRCIGVRCP